MFNGENHMHYASFIVSTWNTLPGSRVNGLLQEGKMGVELCGE